MSSTENTTGFDLDLTLEGIAVGSDNREIESLIKCLGDEIDEAKTNIAKEWELFGQETEQTVDTNVTSLKDITEIFQDKIKHEQHSCFTEPTSLNVFLNNVVQALERNPGLEIQIFDELIDFCAEQGLVLPTPQVEATHNITSSTASLNVVFSMSEENTDELWENICKRISQELLSNIDRLPLTQNKELASRSLIERVSYLEKMLILYLPSDVWKKYCGLRKQQIERFIKKPSLLDDFHNSGSQYSNVIEICAHGVQSEVIRLVKISHVITTMLQEDYKLLELGMFTCKNDEIFSVYLSLFAKELNEAMRNLQTMSQRGSTSTTRDGHEISVVLSSEVFISLRLCVAAAALVNQSATKLVNSLDFSCNKKQRKMSSMENPYGSTLSIPTSPMEAFSCDKGPSTLVCDNPKDQVGNGSIIWPWQDDFTPLVSKIALAIAEHMQYSTLSVLDEEMKYYREYGNYEKIELPAVQTKDDNVEFPKQIAKSCNTILTNLEEILTFLSLKPGTEFEVIRKNIVETLSSTLMAYHTRLKKMSSDVPRKDPISNLYLSFTSAEFIQQKLKQFEEEYGEITSSLLSTYTELVDGLNEKILRYHHVTIATVVLQDVTSHHWMNQKEFFEGERCSFSIQMWNYYMQGIQHDLWQMCSPGKARTIFTSVLQYSLSCLVKRYSKVMPTYHRTKLLRFDITSLLFCVSSWLIYAVSTCVTDILKPDTVRDTINDIHNSCSVLLAIMTIVTCPLETLCLFTVGGAEDLIKDGKSTTTSWLSWLQPQLFGGHTVSLSSLSDIQAVNICFKLAMFQPQPDWALVLQTLFLRHAYLAVTIVSYLDSHMIHIYQEDQDDDDSNSIKKTKVQFLDQCSVTDSNDIDDASQGIVGSLYYVLHKCCKHSPPLVNFVVALINRENSWQIFTSIEGLRFRSEDQAPVWWECLYNTLKPFMTRSTQLCITELSGGNRSFPRSFKFTGVSSLPCGCDVSPDTNNEKQKDKVELVFCTFEKILGNLVQVVPFLPRILFNVFNRIEGDLQQLKLTSADGESCAGLKILGSMLFRNLTSVDVTSIPDGSTWPAGEIVKQCGHLAQLLYHILSGQFEGFYENAGLPVALESLVNGKRVWIEKQVKRINEIFTRSDWSETKEESSGDGLVHLQYSLQVKELFLDPKGEKTLKQIYQFLKSKKDWILRRIPIASHLGTLQQMPSESPVDTFDPLVAYQSLGGYPFDHGAIESFPYDWEQMFQSNIGVTLKSAKRLVYNRYELQDGQDVEQDKLQLVEKLRVFYDRDNEVV